ncbi:KCTD1_15 [Mytilus edulis]|uniref:KCTD1_15 n=1 Tax=Mytilus edulis TaxID=6550 RepID=A0A8S3QVY4_MYTED|nr:KCTD1_15 [Mytilus edulis]
MKRFASHSEEDVIAKKQNLVPVNTVKANKGAANLLRSYLREKNMDTNFESFEIHRLAETLSHFYMDARTKEGEMYKSTTLINTRHALNRYLKSPPFLKKFDLIKNTEFTDANECFKTAKAEIKSVGKGDIVHYPEIESEDLTKLYNSIYLDPSTPFGLANRVQMNIRLYFCRRANENMESMTKETFVVKTYANTGRKYILKKVDEMTKNQRESDHEKVSGHMPEDPEMPEYCPVKNFETYLSKLHPDSDRLWQYPKESFNSSDECWFTKRPIGKDTLSSFLSTLSNKVGLSTTYTNHSIRATGATILGRNCSMAQIMSVTGHKSASSVAVYQRVSNREKQVMGEIITNSVRGQQPSSLSVMPATNTAALMPVSTTSNELVSTSTTFPIIQDKKVSTSMTCSVNITHLLQSATLDLFYKLQ